MVKRVLISSNTPVYVAGLDRGVLPIGFCDIATSLSILSKPKIFLTYSKNGGVEFFNKEIKLDDLKIEENRITSVNVTID